MNKIIEVNMELAKLVLTKEEFLQLNTLIQKVKPSPLKEGATLLLRNADGAIFTYAGDCTVGFDNIYVKEQDRHVHLGDYTILNKINGWELYRNDRGDIVASHQSGSDHEMLIFNRYDRFVNWLEAEMNE